MAALGGDVEQCDACGHPARGFQFPGSPLPRRLEVMREGVLQPGESRLLQVREMATRSWGWHEKHVLTMDAVFAPHLPCARFDPTRTDASRPGVVRVA